MRTLPLLLLLAGCAAAPEPRYQIALESEPAGARVYLDKSFLGTTPCQTEIAGERDGRFKPKTEAITDWFGVDGYSYTFTAELPGSTNRVEKKFRAKGPLWPGERIPEKLFFELSPAKFQTRN